MTLHAWTWRWPSQQPARTVIPHHLPDRRRLDERMHLIERFVTITDTALGEPSWLLGSVVRWIEYVEGGAAEHGGDPDAPIRIEFSDPDPGAFSWMRFQWTRNVSVGMPGCKVRVPIPLDAPSPREMPAFRRNALVRSCVEAAASACRAAMDPAMLDLGEKMAKDDSPEAFRCAVVASLDKPFGRIERPVSCDLPDPSLARPGVVATDAPLTDPGISAIPVPEWSERPRVARWRTMLIPETPDSHILVSTPPRIHFPSAQVNDPIAAMRALRTAS